MKVFGLQTGQPVPDVLLLTVAVQRWRLPVALSPTHTNSVMRRDPAVSRAARGRSTISEATRGCVVATSFQPGITARLQQAGQPFPARARVCMGALHVNQGWPDEAPEHTNSTTCADPALIRVARSLSAICDAICGCVVATSFQPGMTACPEQAGHPAPRVRDASTADHPNAGCPLSQTNTTTTLLKADNWLARPSRTICAAMSGCVVATSFQPASTARHAHTGQPVPSLARLLMAASQVNTGWPSRPPRQSHVTRWLDPG